MVMMNLLAGLCIVALLASAKAQGTKATTQNLTRITTDAQRPSGYSTFAATSATTNQMVPTSKGLTTMMATPEPLPPLSTATPNVSPSSVVMTTPDPFTTPTTAPPPSTVMMTTPSTVTTTTPATATAIQKTTACNRGNGGAESLPPLLLLLLGVLLFLTVVCT